MDLGAGNAERSPARRSHTHSFRSYTQTDRSDRIYIACSYIAGKGHGLTGDRNYTAAVYLHHSIKGAGSRPIAEALEIVRGSAASKGAASS